MKRFQTFVRTIPFVAAGALAGCNLVGPSTVSSISPDYDPGEYARATQAHEIPVTVQGGAFGVDQAALAQAVARDMTGQDLSGRGRFTTTPSAGSDSMFSFAFAFNGPSPASPDALCQNRTAAAAPAATAAPAAGGDVRLLAALCRFNKAATTVQARVSGATGPQDPKFAALIAAATRDLTPVMTTDPLKESIETTD